MRADLLRSLETADRDVQQIQIAKQASPAIFPDRRANPSAVHVNAGIQRSSRRQPSSAPTSSTAASSTCRRAAAAIDLNHFNSVAVRSFRRAARPTHGIRRRCARAARSSCTRRRSASRYKGVLLRAEKRVSRGLQLLASYAYSRNAGTNIGNGFDLDNWLANTGPSASDITHIGERRRRPAAAAAVRAGVQLLICERAAIQRVRRRHRFQR